MRQNHFQCPRPKVWQVGFCRGKAKDWRLVYSKVGREDANNDVDKRVRWSRKKRRVSSRDFAKA